MLIQAPVRAPGSAVSGSHRAVVTAGIEEFEDMGVVHRRLSNGRDVGLVSLFLTERDPA
jgi:hypothetical protein